MEGYPVLQHATSPPVYDSAPLVVNRELVVLEPLRGTHVVLACPHCGHTGPAAVSKACSPLLSFLAASTTSAPCHDSSLAASMRKLRFRALWHAQESGFVTFFSSFLLCFLGCCILSIFPFCSDCTKVHLAHCRLPQLYSHTFCWARLPAQSVHKGHSD